ncbi:hypothetical protein C8R48DRAFT_677693 [Suillus tomentosus]|nr:hypothetical protein C8R48DRAFT_677693 [Suillus tomentosus]
MTLASIAGLFRVYVSEACCMQFVSGLIVTAQAPMFWGTLADRMGRRPTSLGCLFVLSLACICLAFVSTSYFWLLMVLRCLQAVGSASLMLTIAKTSVHIDESEYRTSPIQYWSPPNFMHACSNSAFASTETYADPPIDQL